MFSFFNREIVTLDHQVKTGDIYEAHFRLIPFFQDWQIQHLIDQVNQNEKYKIISHRQEENSLILTIQIVKNPFLLSLVILGILGVAGGIFAYFSLDKVYKITSNPLVSLTLLTFAIGLLYKNIRG